MLPAFTISLFSLSFSLSLSIFPFVYLSERHELRLPSFSSPFLPSIPSIPSLASLNDGLPVKEGEEKREQEREIAGREK